MQFVHMQGCLNTINNGSLYNFCLFGLNSDFDFF